MIIPVWQQQGSSTHLLAHKIGVMVAERATHTGTLDPMAEGVVVVLTGQDRFLKGAATAWKKTYTFSIVWGVHTDSGDTLGIIDTHSEIVPDISQITRSLKKHTTTYNQNIHPFSARRYQGSSSFLLARQNKCIPHKKREVTIYSLSLDDYEHVTLSCLAVQEMSKIQNITGDFRQSEILKCWETYSHLSTQVLVTHHTAVVSTGTYIRQLTQDIADALAMPALTKDIVRTQNGKYTQQHCETDQHHLRVS